MSKETKNALLSYLMEEEEKNRLKRKIEKVEDDLGDDISEVEGELGNKADSSDVYTKKQIATEIASAQSIARMDYKFPGNIQLLENDWIVGEGGTPNFIRCGSFSENQRVIGTNPHGEKSILWECRPMGNNNADGGWNSKSFEIDKTKTYRFSVFIKTNDNEGKTYFGCEKSSVYTLNSNSLQGDSYFFEGGILPKNNKWYLFVGFVFPAGGNNYTKSGGIYDCETGEHVWEILKSFQWAPDTSDSYHRCFHYYNETNTTRQWMYHPRVDLVNGSEPSISSLLGKTVTPESIGARRDDWMPTAAEVGARSTSWTPTATEVGARPSDWMPTIKNVWDISNDWKPTAAEVGARSTSWTPEVSDLPTGIPQGNIDGLDVKFSVVHEEIETAKLDVRSDFQDYGSVQLLDNDWTIGEGSTPNFSRNGDVNENFRVIGTDPHGEKSIIWECRPSGDGLADGGWNSKHFEIDKSKTYRMSVFIKTDNNNGNTYFGCGKYSVCELNKDEALNNPYFFNGGYLPENNKWYLFVAYIFPAGGREHVKKGGIYDCETGKLAREIPRSFQWALDAESSYHRCFHYFNTTTTTSTNRQYMYHPRVDLVNGNEPSILSLLGKVTPESIGARSTSWTPTATEVGARPSDWMPTIKNVWDISNDWKPTAAEVGARSTSWTPEVSDLPTGIPQGNIDGLDVEFSVVRDEIKTAKEDVKTDLQNSGNVQLLENDWTVGIGGTPNFSRYGAVDKSVRVIGRNPYDEDSILWECRPDNRGVQDGGWFSRHLEIDKTKIYRFTTFIRTNNDSGYTGFALQSDGVCKIDGNSSFEYAYFWDGKLPKNDTWYLIVAYVFPFGDVNYNHQGGMYSCETGLLEEDISVKSFKWSEIATFGRHRCYHYENVDTSTRQWMYHPRVDLVNGNEPSILSLLGKVTPESIGAHASSWRPSISDVKDLKGKVEGYDVVKGLVENEDTGLVAVNGRLDDPTNGLGKAIELGNSAIAKIGDDQSGILARVKTAETKIVSANEKLSETKIELINNISKAKVDVKTDLQNSGNVQLLDNDWTLGTGSTPNFHAFGEPDKSVRVINENPFGENSIIWECKPDKRSLYDGGWNSKNLNIDHTKMYRFSAFVKTTDRLGYTFLALRGDGVLNINETTSLTSPYFYQSYLPQNEKWYLIVAYVFPSGGVNYSHQGGIYSCETGKKEDLFVRSFQWSENATYCYHRCFHYHNDNTSSRQWMYHPRVDLVNGNEPSILSLLGKVTPESIGARKDNWMPTATEVGARSDSWEPKISEVIGLDSKFSSIGGQIAGKASKSTVYTQSQIRGLISNSKEDLKYDLMDTGNIQILRNDWRFGNGGTEFFRLVGQGEENSRVYNMNPQNEPSLLWEFNPARDKESSGGWETEGFRINPEKMYRYSVFVKTDQYATIDFRALPGSICYFGSDKQCEDPFFLSKTPMPNTWLLIIGYVFPFGYEGPELNGQIYDCTTGQPLEKILTTSFNWYKYDETAHISFIRNNPKFCNPNYFYQPRVDLVNGAEPSVRSLIGAFNQK